MTARDRYATPAAFRAALSDRAKAAAASGPWTIQQLQRQVAYDRLLERLYNAFDITFDGRLSAGRNSDPATLDLIDHGVVHRRRGA